THPFFAIVMVERSRSIRDIILSKQSILNISPKVMVYRDSLNTPRKGCEGSTSGKSEAYYYVRHRWWSQIDVDRLVDGFRDYGQVMK
ncbi:unnamed protein product, partial [marine sediment metagenome]